jgi:hypothetical protein
MLKFLIGPTLIGAGYLAGSIYGRDSEQLVHKSSATTYAAVEDALSGVQRSGTTFFDGGTPMPYELKVERSADLQLVLKLFFDGKQGAEADVDFVPKDDGKSTMMVARIHSDHGVLRTALAGTNKAKLAYAPDWMLNLAMRPVLQQLAQQIEEGGAAGDALQGWSPADAEAKWEAQLTPEQRQAVAAGQQYDATRPALDLNGGNSGN